MITSSIVIFKTDRDELAAVLRCSVASCVEKVYIVDNSPTNELGDFVRNISPKIDYIFGHGNVGYGAAHNIAIRKAMQAGAAYHVVLNPDIQFGEGAVERIASYMDANRVVGQVMPKIIYPDGELQYLCKLQPTPLDLIGRRFIPIKSYVERRNRRFEMRDSGYDKIMEVPFLSGCFMFLRVDALEKVGGFDDRYFMYCEDLDLCRRIGRCGYKTMYYPEVSVIHIHKKESFVSREMLKAHMKSAIRYFTKWGWVFDGERRAMNKRALNQFPPPTILARWIKIHSQYFTTGVSHSCPLSYPENPGMTFCF